MTDKEFEEIKREILGEPVLKERHGYDPRFAERNDNPTPSGGDYSVAFYYDEEHNPCIREEAWYINIVEYTADGARINEHYGMTGRASCKDSQKS